MNRAIKTFYKNRKNEDYHFNDIFDADFSEIPNGKKGVYIMLAKHASFLYPNKKESSVFYIGMSLNLKRRLNTHKKWSNRLKEKNHDERIEWWYKDVYQYAASFGAELYVFTTRGKQTPKDLESEIMEYFYDKYLGKPVSNGAFSFKK